jgi:nucleoside phosphorylase
MSRIVIIVPKFDELQAVRWAFGKDLSRPDETLPSGVRIFHRDVHEIPVSFALMDSQNNTNSAIAAASVFLTENPSLAFLTGTALGRSGRVDIGDIIMTRNVREIIERRMEGGRWYWINNQIPSSPELNLPARQFCSESYNQDRLTDLAWEAAREMRVASDTEINSFFRNRHLRVHYEDLASGNEYFMDREEPAQQLWNTLQTVRAYDMESAGFAYAATSFGSIQWLAVRGISDFGTEDSKSELHRAIASALAARFLSDFISYLKRTGTIAADDPARKSQRSTILYTLDDHGVQRFHEMVDGASQVDVLSRTSVNLLGTYRSTFATLVQSGCRIRMLVVDPHSDVAKYLYGSNPDLFTSNLRTTVQHVRDIEGQLGVRVSDDESPLQIRLLREFPPFSMTRVQRPNGEAIVRVQLNFLYTLISRDRPVFDLSAGSDWYTRFESEFDAIWNSPTVGSFDEISDRDPTASEDTVLPSRRGDEEK